jgi:hypothetical protein
MTCLKIELFRLSPFLHLDSVTIAIQPTSFDLKLLNNFHYTLICRASSLTDLDSF